jgi:hypothetical protein
MSAERLLDLPIGLVIRIIGVFCAAADRSSERVADDIGQPIPNHNGRSLMKLTSCGYSGNTDENGFKELP